MDKSYPDLEAIPPAKARRPTFPVPTWAIKIFSTFPLHTWSGAEVVSPPPSPPLTKPTLYVAPALREGTWTSADPTCLRWQMSLLFHGVDYETQYLSPRESWGPKAQLPFLHLPPAFQPSSRGTWLITPQEMPLFLDTHFPTHRVELGEKKELNLEARSWENILRGRVMAGVLLAGLLCPQTETSEKEPILSGFLSAQLQTTHLDEQLRRIATLNPTSRAQPISKLPGWEVGFLRWVGFGTLSDEYDIARADASVDEEQVLYDAVNAIQALGKRTQEELEAGEEWLLGEKKPTELDALAFAVVHTVMTKAATPEGKEARQLERLKEALEQYPWLINWSRSVWKSHVKAR